MMFVGKKTLPVATFPELIAYVKANRDKVTKGHAGIGSASHLCGLLFLGAIKWGPLIRKAGVTAD